MKQFLTLKTLLMLRRAALALVAAIDAAALEGFGWTPRRSSTPVDIDQTVYTDSSTHVRAEA